MNQDSIVGNSQGCHVDSEMRLRCWGEIKQDERTKYQKS